MRISLALSIILSLVFCSCQSTSTPTIVANADNTDTIANDTISDNNYTDDNYEPNNTKQLSTSLNLNIRQNHIIIPNDQDWFLVKGDHKRLNTVKIIFDNFYDKEKIRFSIFNSDGVKIPYLESSVGSSKEIVWCPNVSDNYFFSIESAEKNSYSYSIVISEYPDSKNQDAAKELEIGTLLEHETLEEMDTNCYKIFVEEGKYYSITAVSDTSSVGFFSKPIFEFNSGHGYNNKVSTEFKATESGYRFVFLYDYRGIKQNYSFVIDNVEPGELDIFEPNDNIDNSTPLTPNDTVFEHTIHLLDYDYFRISEVKGKKYRITIDKKSMFNECAISFIQNDPYHSWIDTPLEQNGTIFTIQWEADNTGEKYLKVFRHDADRNEYSIQFVEL